MIVEITKAIKIRYGKNKKTKTNKDKKRKTKEKNKGLESFDTINSEQKYNVCIIYSLFSSLWFSLDYCFYCCVSQVKIIKIKISKISKYQNIKMSNVS